MYGKAEKASAENVRWEGDEHISVQSSTERPRRYQRTAIDGKAEKLSAESVR
jgi:hypothetical protein